MPMRCTVNPSEWQANLRSMLNGDSSNGHHVHSLWAAAAQSAQCLTNARCIRAMRLPACADISRFCVQFLFNFCSCSAVAAAAMNAGGNALLNTGLVMAAHMVRKSTPPLHVHPMAEDLSVLRLAKHQHLRCFGCLYKELSGTSSNQRLQE